MKDARNYISDSVVRRRKRRKYFFLFSWAAVMLALIIFFAWFFIASPFFRIQKITITGTNFVSQSDATTLLRGSIFKNLWIKHLLGWRNILVWPDALTTQDVSFYPAIKSVSISKKYFKRSIEVKIMERTQIGVWCYGSDSDNCWWFDDEGALFKRSPSTRGSLIVTVRDYSQQGGGLGSKILPEQFMGNFLSIIKVLQDAHVQESEVLIKNIALQEVEVPLSQGPILYFSLRFSSGNTLAGIERLMRRPDFKNLTYIDFRVENKVYFK